MICYLQKIINVLYNFIVNFILKWRLKYIIIKPKDLSVVLGKRYLWQGRGFFLQQWKCNSCNLLDGKNIVAVSEISQRGFFYFLLLLGFGAPHVYQSLEILYYSLFVREHLYFHGIFDQLSHNNEW